MLRKLGGKKTLQEATDIFYDRQIEDPRLLKFFKGTDMAILKWHQFNRECWVLLILLRKVDCQRYFSDDKNGNVDSNSINFKI